MPTLKEGDKFERYHILRTLGNGTTGVSYEAEDTRQQRTVVLKLLHSWDPLSDTVRRQFFREIQTISSIAHPQLAPILNYGEWHKQLFVVRTFTSHGSFLNDFGRTWLHQPLDTHVAINYGVQIAKVLNYIHKIGYAHGSLTFSNILVAQKPKANQTMLPILISDIGLATFVQSQEHPPTTTLPITAAPEQFKGQTIPASDQYALAVMIYIWLTGRSPFSGSPEEIVRLKNQETIQYISPSNTNVSRELEAVLRRALSAYPRNRFATIYEFIYALAKTKQSPTTQPITNTIKNAPEPPTTQPTANIVENAPESPVTQPIADTIENSPEPATIQPIDDTIETPQEPPALQPIADTIENDPQPSISIVNAYLAITLQESTKIITYQITQDETSLGRAGSSDVLLEEDTNISRHHALIRKDNNQYTIYDCRSTDGISVNGQKLLTETAYPLTNNDQILIGNYTLRFYDTPSVHIETEQQEHVHS